MTTPTRETVTTHRSPSTESTLLYWGARATLRQFYRGWPLTDSGIRMLGLIERGFTRLPHPEGVSSETTLLSGVPTVVTTPDTVADDAAGDDTVDDATVFYVHGGGFMFCGPGTHRRICSSLARRLGAPVYSVGYRKLPEFGAGTAVGDVYEAYRALSDQLPAGHRIVVAGDSACGFLTAKLCELAALDGIRRPAAWVGFSPLLDLDGEVRDGRWPIRDAYQPASTVRRAQKLWDRGPEPLRGGRSLLDCDPAIFPPSLMTAAAGELLEPDVLTLTERLHAGRRTVETHRWHTAVHAFPVLDTLTPESRRAGEITVEFLRRVLAD